MSMLSENERAVNVARGWSGEKMAPTRSMVDSEQLERTLGGGDGGIRVLSGNC